MVGKLVHAIARCCNFDFEYTPPIHFPTFRARISLDYPTTPSHQVLFLTLSHLLLPPAIGMVRQYQDYGTAVSLEPNCMEGGERIHVPRLTLYRTVYVAAHQSIPREMTRATRPQGTASRGESCSRMGTFVL